jgi:hypothetical protein
MVRGLFSLGQAVRGVVVCAPSLTRPMLFRLALLLCLTLQCAASEGGLMLLNVFEHDTGIWRYAGPNWIANDPGSRWDEFAVWSNLNDTAKLLAFSADTPNRLHVFTHDLGVFTHTSNHQVLGDPGTAWSRGMAVQNRWMYGLASGSNTVLNFFENTLADWNFAGTQAILNDPGSNWDQGFSITNFAAAQGPPSMMVFKIGSDSAFNVFNFNGQSWDFVGENFLIADDPATDWDRGFGTQFYTDGITTALYGFAVPEPATLALATALMALLVIGRRFMR